MSEEGTSATAEIPTLEWDAAAIEAHFAGLELGPEMPGYIAYHALRYELLLELLDRSLRRIAERRGGSALSILDVGAGPQTTILRHRLPTIRIDTLGFDDHRFQRREGDHHLSFDLNDAVDPARWPGSDPYDLVIAGEVIEHLHVPIESVLSLFRSLARSGGLLVVQTPNACSIQKRYAMLRGRNPFEMIRASRENPGHFREYTLAELRLAGNAVGLRVTTEICANYFRSGTWKNRLFTLLGPLVPPTLRSGITVVYTNP